MTQLLPAASERENEMTRVPAHDRRFDDQSEWR